MIDYEAQLKKAIVEKSADVDDLTVEEAWPTVKSQWQLRSKVPGDKCECGYNRNISHVFHLFNEKSGESAKVDIICSLHFLDVPDEVVRALVETAYSKDQSDELDPAAVKHARLAGWITRDELNERDPSKRGEIRRRALIRALRKRFGPKTGRWPTRSSRVEVRIESIPRRSRIKPRALRTVRLWSEERAARCSDCGQTLPDDGLELGGLCWECNG